MKFTKMHGIGNDYVYVNGFEEKLDDPGAVARKISDRHFGIGSDGLIMILPSDKADVRMRMFNVDGSEGEMCGNGIRCVAKYAYDHGLAKSNPMRVETGRGVLTLDLKTNSRDKVEQVTVNMGEPILDHTEIPFDRTYATQTTDGNTWTLTFSDATTRGQEQSRPMAGTQPPIDVVPVSMGNPHCVSFVGGDVDSLNLLYLGPLVEHHRAFPRRVNAHWAQVISRDEVRMRTWERGSGITWACGTGACAVVVAGVLTDRFDRKVLVHLPGGDLRVEWREREKCVYMTGPATEVFSGDWQDASSV